MTLSARHEIARMARYHIWATQRLLGAVAALSDEDYRRDCGLFFGSVHGGLNHLLLTDGGIWYPRFTGAPVETTVLDAEVESDRAALADRLNAAVARWPDYIDSLDDAALAGTLAFTATDGRARSLPRAAALLHVFNHGTHHRGQITSALTMMGVDYPPLDLAYLIFAEQAG